jgi:hypothetical protein
MALSLAWLEPGIRGFDKAMTFGSGAITIAAILAAINAGITLIASKHPLSVVTVKP